MAAVIARHVQAGTEDPRLQTVAMLENINQLDGSTVDKRCLMRQVDALVRWANRLCAGDGVSEEVFAFSFVREAGSRCP